MWKFIGALIGLLIAGWPGALIGLGFGWFYENSSLSKPRVFGPFADLQAKREQYFVSTFRLMGHVAKADGRISEEEIELTETLMQRMGLTVEHRREAIAQFKEGAASSFDRDAEIAAFAQRCGQGGSLANMLMVTLISVAFADLTLDSGENQALETIAAGLGFSEAQYRQLLEMVTAQNGFADEAAALGQAASANDLALAYQALGVTPEVDNKTLKQAYRRLISKHHPDKLIAQGVPDDMVALATERSQEIQTAYDLIQKSRQS